MRDAFHYTDDDLAHAQYANINLDAQKAVAAREAIEQKLDKIGYVGDVTHNLLGFLNQPNVPVYALLNDGNQNGGTNSTRFRHKTPAQIYRDLVNFASATRIATKGVESPEVIAMPQEEFDIIMATPYSENGSNGESILTVFLRNQRMSPSGVQEVLPFPYLEAQGIGGTDMMVSYRRRESKIKLHIPQDFPMQGTGSGHTSVQTSIASLLFGNLGRSLSN